jgi:type I pantothenate kinase
MDNIENLEDKIDNIENNAMQSIVDIITKHKKVPFFLGISGSVSSGKTTFANQLKNELAKRGKKTAVVSSDSFLYNNETLQKRDLLKRKGFPETYDYGAITHLFHKLSNLEPATIPIYSHEIYDIVPDRTKTIKRVDIAIFEGVMALQNEIVRNFFDLSIFLNMTVSDLETSFLNRFLQLRNMAKNDPTSFYNQYYNMPKEQALDIAKITWKEVNEKNLVENVLPSKQYADIVLQQNGNHEIVGYHVTPHINH